MVRGFEKEFEFAVTFAPNITVPHIMGMNAFLGLPAERPRQSSAAFLRPACSVRKQSQKTKIVKSGGRGGVGGQGGMLLTAV